MREQTELLNRKKRMEASVTSLPKKIERVQVYSSFFPFFFPLFPFFFGIILLTPLLPILPLLPTLLLFLGVPLPQDSHACFDPPPKFSKGTVMSIYAFHAKNSGKKFFFKEVGLISFSFFALYTKIEVKF